MTENEYLRQQNQRTLILVSINFVMFLILFSGLGYVAWKSSTLITKLETDLAKAEQAVVRFQGKLEHLDIDTLMAKVMQGAKENLGESVKTALNQSDFGGSLSNLSEKVENAQGKLERISTAVQEANDNLRNIDTEQLAQLVSYNMLKGLGEGFTNAAESRKPASFKGEN